MDAPSPDDPDENLLVKLTSLLVLGAGLLALFSGYGRFWVVFVIGFAVLVPIVKLVTDEFGSDVGADESVQTESERSDPESKQGALDALRGRYARGELSETEFERKVETLLETETLEDARERVAHAKGPESESETEMTETDTTETDTTETDTTETDTTETDVDDEREREPERR